MELIRIASTVIAMDLLPRVIKKQENVSTAREIVSDFIVKGKKMILVE